MNIQKYADLKFRRDALMGLDRYAGEVITDILTIIETCEPEEAQMRLLMRGKYRSIDQLLLLYCIFQSSLSVCLTFLSVDWL